MEEIEARTITSTCPNRQGYINLEVKMLQKVQKVVNRHQLNNLWDTCRRQFQTWCQLIDQPIKLQIVDVVLAAVYSLHSADQRYKARLRQSILVLVKINYPLDQIMLSEYWINNTHLMCLVQCSKERYNFPYQVKSNNPLLAIHSLQNPHRSHRAIHAVKIVIVISCQLFCTQIRPFHINTVTNHSFLFMPLQMRRGARAFRNGPLLYIPEHHAVFKGRVCTLNRSGVPVRTPIEAAPQQAEISPSTPYKNHLSRLHGTGRGH